MHEFVPHPDPTWADFCVVPNPDEDNYPCGWKEEDHVHVTVYDGPPCPVCGVATDDEGEKGQIGTFLAVCMNLECIMFSRYVEVRNA